MLMRNKSSFESVCCKFWGGKNTSFCRVLKKVDLSGPAGAPTSARPLPPAENSPRHVLLLPLGFLPSPISPHLEFSNLQLIRNDEGSRAGQEGYRLCRQDPSFAQQEGRRDKWVEGRLGREGKSVPGDDLAILTI